MTAPLEARSHRELLDALKAGASKSFQQTAEVLRVLGEVDHRRAWTTKAYSSLFAYCVGELHWSEGETYKKIQACRAGREFPVLLDRLGEGKLNLSGIVLLAPKLTPDNHAALIEAACGLSKRALEAMLATRFPKPDVAESIRKLPASAPKAATPPLASPPPPHAPTPSAPAAPSKASPGQASAPGLQLEPPTPRPKVEPLSAQRHKLTVTISGETRARIERIQALSSHRGSEQQTLEAVLDGALELLEAKLLKERYGIGAKPRAPRKPSLQTSEPEATVPGDSPEPEAVASAAVPDAADAPAAPPGCPDDLAPRGGWPRTFSRADRRRIVARDGLRCAYVDPETGQRCGETRWLTFEHIQPWARGGPTTADNGQLLCASHNHLRARQAFGDDLIEARIAAG